MIPTFNHAHFLADALQSVLAQTLAPDEVIVVDDGSRDDPAAVVANFPSVRLIRQENRGLSAARNAGMRAATSDLVLFLDADDALEAEAIASGLGCMLQNPGAAFVYGGHVRTDARLEQPSAVEYKPLSDRPILDFLRGNPVGMPGTVLFDRNILARAGGFDESIAKCEDYDCFLRLARSYPVAGHSALVARYRIHHGTLSSDYGAMLAWTLAVLERHRPESSDVAARAAYRQGRRHWRRIYASAAWNGPHASLPARAALLRRAPVESVLMVAWLIGKAVLPPPLARRLKAKLQPR